MFSADHSADKESEVDQPKSAVSKILSRFSVSQAKEEPPPQPPSSDSQPPPSRKKCIIITVVVVVLLLLLLLVGVLVYVFVLHESDPEPAPVTMDTEPSLAEQIKKLMNTSVNPCDNFYKYACGGWTSQDNISRVQGEKSFLSDMNLTTNKQLIDMLERPAKEGDPPYKLRTMKFFTDCSDMEKLKRDGVTPFFELLKPIGKFPVLESKWHDSDLNLQQLITQLTLLGIEPLFTLKPEYSNDTDGFIFGIAIGNPKRSHPYDQQDKEWTRSTLQHLGADVQNPEVVNEIEQIFKVQEEAFNQKFESHYDTGPHPLATIEKYIAWGNFSWLKFFTDISGDVSLNNKTMVHVQNWLYVDRIYRHLVSTFNKRAVVDYLMLDLLKFTVFLDDRFKPRPNLSRDFEFGSDRKNGCLELVKVFFKDEVSQMYADEVYNTSLTSYVKEIMVNLKQAYNQSIEATKWLSDHRAKVNTLQQLKTMNEHVGYIKGVHDAATLKNYLNKVNSYFEFFPAYIREMKTRLFHLYAAKNQAGVYQLFGALSSHLPSSITVGLQYQNTTNTLFVPAAFLQYPVINLKWPRSMNYGALGSLLGHEFMHAFLTGLNTSRLNNIESNAFVYKIRCVLSIYADFSLGDLKVNETLWLDENLCDYVGVSQSFRAYQIYRQRKGDEEAVPGLDLNHNQLFFLSFTQMFCQVISKDRMQDALNQTHAPNYFRASGSLMTSKDFIKTYGCHKGTNMDRKRKCNFFDDEYEKVFFK